MPVPGPEQLPQVYGVRNNQESHAATPIPRARRGIPKHPRVRSTLLIVKRACNDKQSMYLSRTQPRCNIIAGRPCTLPAELLVYLFKFTDLDGAAHAHLFVIGYASIRARIRAVKLRTDRAYDRIMSFGNRACTLPRGFLSDAKHRLERWQIAHEATLDIGTGALHDALHARTQAETTEEREERKRELAAYGDHLGAFAGGMPSLYNMANSASSFPTL
ncbi:hypothetical protein BDN71DRAFT_1514151 [Pleurotus eryngii]|uniref:Uncharacterized protein n=1 Tax=Pleurotus eryngii TaxID=5323 RepID=A0A9P5ZGW8_PLEER|nr:hypothetical protein BDN71DRAFT_1514151 [Pleurotus eryngii]